MSNRRGLVVLLVVLVILQAPSVLSLTAPSHTSTAGVTYQTNSGLTVTLGDEREVEASPYNDDQTWASRNVTLSAPGSAEAQVDDNTFSGETMNVNTIDATQNPVRINRTDGINAVNISGGTTDIIAHDVTLEDGNTDLEVVAGSSTKLTVKNLPDVNGIQAVDANGNVVAGDTDTSDNEVELQLDAGTYDLRLQDGPSQLEIRAIEDKELVTQDSNGDPINVEVQFFGSDGSVQQRNTTDGTIGMTGLPADERFAVTVDTGDAYVQRQIIITSLLEQQTAFLLNQSTSVDTVEPRFILEDPTNQFDTEQSEIVLERPLEINGSTEFVAVAGDRVGINGYDVILERDQRYRVTVTDPTTGAQRTVGEFTPTQSEEVILTVQDVEFDSVSDVDGLEWTARYITNENGQDEIEFIFRDQFDTQSLEYEIHERGNASNVLLQDTASGNVTITEPVPSSGNDTVWVVNWTTTRATGETLSAQRPVSTDDLHVGPPELDQRWQTIAAMLGLFAVAGLFGAASPGIGGIVVAGTGGMFYMIGWLPDQTGGLMVVLALFIAALSYAARRARGARA